MIYLFQITGLLQKAVAQEQPDGRDAQGKPSSPCVHLFPNPEALQTVSFRTFTGLHLNGVIGKIAAGQGGLACCDSWGFEESNMTE